MATKQHTATEIKAAAALTDAYASGWESSWHDVGNATEATFLLTLVKDGATTVELVVDVEQLAGTTGYTRLRVGSDGAAAVDQAQLTCSALGATETLSLPIDVRDVRRVRLRAKRTGGDSGTTLAASVLVGAQQ
jgi:hypothetical protein